MAQGWGVGTVGWLAVVSWLCANILSQAAYMGTFGEPFQAELMIAHLGDWFWVAFAIESLVYIFLGRQLWRVAKRRMSAGEQADAVA